jgi:hypothetical protein
VTRKKRQTHSEWTIEEFCMSVEADLNSGCWLWSNGMVGPGYGITRHAGKPILAHRLSWILFRGEIPKGEGFHGTCVLHKCDVRACVNPDHLFLGTNLDNIKDRVAKGRSNTPVMRGEKNPSAKLTTDDVKMIRSLRGVVSGVNLAKRFGVTPQNICSVQKQASWRFNGEVVSR